MKWAVYNILFALVYPFLLPGFLVRMIRRGGYAARMGDRFALYPQELTDRFRPKPGDPKGAFDKSGHPCPPKSDFVWIHAVSVGEVQVAGQLMRAWRTVDPSVRFCFSTTSSTGWKMALREVKGEGEGDGEGDVLIYNPLDFPNFVKSALKLVRPRAIVLTESEIWPNFIRKAKSYGIPLFLVNARVSDRSAPRYARARFFFKDVFGCFTRIFAQSDLDKARLVAAGAPAERIDVTGSFKFDVAKRNEAKERELREWIFGTSGGPRSVAAATDGTEPVPPVSATDGTEPVPPVSAAGRPEVAPYHASASAQGGPRSVAAAADGTEPVPPVSAAGRPEVAPYHASASAQGGLRSVAAAVTSRESKILLGGSIWPGEDEILLRVYRKLLDLQPSTFDLQPLLVLAPRHFEKADQVEANIRAAGFDCVRRSRVDAESSPRQNKNEPTSLHLHLSPSPAPSAPPVFLCDTTGEMMGLFGICDVAFVGKSLCAHGSQNMIEPCLCGKPTVVGPYTENFRPVMSDLLAAEAIVQVAPGGPRSVAAAADGTGPVPPVSVSPEAAVEREIIRLMTDDAAARELGARAAAAVVGRQGVVPRCVAAIRKEIS